MTAQPLMTPHTAAKHLLLKRYLDAWFPILGKYNKRLNYFDGFAGPGIYDTGEEGSPIIAIKSALESVRRNSFLRGTEFNFIFVEASEANRFSLEESLKSIDTPDEFGIHVIGDTFREAIADILRHFQSTDQYLAPTFAFVDPFGFKGIPLTSLASVLSHPKCEIFVNIMVDHINRFLEHPDDTIVSHFPETFGTDDVLNIPKMASNRKEAILDLYKEQLKQHAKYVGQFGMKNIRHRTLYSLFFASNSDKGFRKMKEAMWSVDTQSGKEFSDHDTEGFYRFDLFKVSPLQEDIQVKFGGQQALKSTVEDFVIRETDYLPKHLHEVLRTLESSGQIQVIPLGGYSRRANTYPRDKIEILFSSNSR
jgi:three-Cys-motif partner protein